MLATNKEGDNCLRFKLVIDWHGERKSKSRDITKVLFGDKIVCTGFASVFTTLVRNLGYQSTNYIVEYGAH